MDICVERHPAVKDETIINGAEAISLGAIAGGCNFVAAYPMTPSTGILTYLSQHAADFGIVAEQAEDEIAAINMVLGAWYAGARGLVATAGGGFSLMVEGLSLAGMIESPAVISVGQRPAPATGLPTRTEQGDLEHVLYAGHGEFPRVILAPGNIEEAFYLSAKAFTIADKFQVPVILLSDQYLADSYYNLPAPDTSRLETGRYIVKTDTAYRRYSITESGISPRGIPGYGEGFVAVDSDEHDEEGHITESMAVRKSMVDKRLRKRALLEQEALPPELIGPPEYSTLVVSWGSNREVVLEALERSGRADAALLHFTQVYPLHASAADYLRKAQRTVIVENNATGQFAKVLQLYTGMPVQERILKYDGMPFSVEELAAKFKEMKKLPAREKIKVI
jgi:2-oxoglutarate ferredoxin oxidoreductase subunit alpha